MRPLAVTIISPSYERVGREGVRRMERFSGLKVKVIEVPDADGFATKINLDRMVGKRAVMFFDSDLWSLRKWEADKIIGSGAFLAVHDSAVWNCHTFCHHDSHKHGLDPMRYFNSGLMFWDNRRQEHREIFRLARKSSQEHKRGNRHYEDKTDQAHLNYGLLHSGVPLQWLPIQYNTYCFGINHGQFPYYPRDIINLHGAGIEPKRKFSRLKVEASVFGQKIFPMHQQAVNFEWDRMFSYR